MGTVGRCTNCYISRYLSVFKEASEDIKSVIAQWIHPREFTATDVICDPCQVLAQTAAKSPGVPRQRGHTKICLMCGYALWRKRHSTLSKILSSKGNTEDQMNFALMTASMIKPLVIEEDSLMCHPCEMKIARRLPMPSEPIVISKANTKRKKRIRTKSPEIETDMIKVELEQNEEVDPLEDCPNVPCEIKKEIDEKEVCVKGMDKQEIDEHKCSVHSDEGNVMTYEYDVKIKKESDTALQGLKDGLEEEYDPKNDLLEEEVYDPNNDLIGEVYDPKNYVLEQVCDPKNKDKLNLDVMKLEMTLEKKADEEINKNATIFLPNFRRAADTSRRCIFDSCKRSLGRQIPKNIKTQLIKDYQYYVPFNARVCNEHWKKGCYNGVINNKRSINHFSAAQIEDMIALACLNPSEVDFDHMEEMTDETVEYWTNISREMYQKILSVTGLNKVNKGSLGLAALLIKFRTNDSRERLCKTLKMASSTLHRYISIAKNALIKHSECITMICSRYSTKNKVNSIKMYFEHREPNLQTRLKYLRKKERLALQARSDIILPPPKRGRPFKFKPVQNSLSIATTDSRPPGDLSQPDASSSSRQAETASATVNLPSSTEPQVSDSGAPALQKRKRAKQRAQDSEDEMWSPPGRGRSSKSALTPKGNSSKTALTPKTSSKSTLTPKTSSKSALTSKSSSKSALTPKTSSKSVMTPNGKSSKSAMTPNSNSSNSALTPNTTSSTSALTPNANSSKFTLTTNSYTTLPLSVNPPSGASGVPSGGSWLCNGEPEPGSFDSMVSYEYW